MKKEKKSKKKDIFKPPKIERYQTKELLEEDNIFSVSGVYGTISCQPCPPD